MPRRQHVREVQRPRARLLRAQPHHLPLHILQRDPYLARAPPARPARRRHSANRAPHARALELERQVRHLPPQHALARGEVALAGRPCRRGRGPWRCGAGYREAGRGGCPGHAWHAWGGERRAGRAQRRQCADTLRSSRARTARRGHDVARAQRRGAHRCVCHALFSTLFEPRGHRLFGVRQPLLDVLRERLAGPRVREAEHGEGRRAREAALDHHVAVEGEALAGGGGAAAVHEDEQGGDEREARERAEDAADERGEVGVRACWGRGSGWAGGEEGPVLALTGWVMGDDEVDVL